MACVVLYNQREAILGLTALAPAALALQMTQILLWTALKIGAALLVLAMLDYAYQWWRHEQDLKMTPQELREELRNLEGNPQVIARRKQVQRDLVLQRLSALVPQANVVLTNPSQLAVAVRYDPETMSAPIVVAKGPARRPSTFAAWPPSTACRSSSRSRWPRRSTAASIQPAHPRRSVRGVAEVLTKCTS